MVISRVLLVRCRNSRLICRVVLVGVVVCEGLSDRCVMVLVWIVWFGVVGLIVGSKVCWWCFGCCLGWCVCDFWYVFVVELCYGDWFVG